MQLSASPAGGNKLPLYQATLVCLCVCVRGNYNPSICAAHSPRPSLFIYSLGGHFILLLLSARTISNMGNCLGCNRYSSLSFCHCSSRAIKKRNPGAPSFVLFPSCRGNRKLRDRYLGKVLIDKSIGLVVLFFFLRKKISRCSKRKNA